MTVKMRVLKPHWRYNKQPLVAGDTFTAFDKDVKVIELARIAERIDSVAKPKRGRPAGTIKKAGSPKTTSAKKPARKGRYQRRDMQAEK